MSSENLILSMIFAQLSPELKGKCLITISKSALRFADFKRRFATMTRRKFDPSQVMLIQGSAIAYGTNQMQDIHKEISHVFAQLLFVQRH